ncbi:glycosyltransferase family 1 protein [Romeria aff. gracilis LEGE 07310]|uniref:Glycosyltransferase family 1 protein n=1 Tax=Vasconcelosia minhoensis LEGE 07310 TaxID=915328 RepID=A0A8J7A4U3_9CYAN|nr:glycosyltransferase family 1 protein [Romeria gracilis]MBE9076337.1 glycosyltransferase family 1 protein [Romeria aff. gracilis LEGE 07310]
MEKELKLKGLVFYITTDVNQLPSYGENVVAIVLDDEWSRIPRYFDKVKAIFKCYGVSPMLGCNLLFNPSYLNLLTTLRFIKICIIGLPGLLKYRFSRFRSAVTKAKSGPIYDIPLGYYKQIELPIRDISKRIYDISFDGSLVNHTYSIRSFKYWLQDPKIISRKKMLESVQKLMITNPSLNIKLTITNGFHTTNNTDSKRYSEDMMNTKICLIPRGATFETYRFFEALRYGCIVVTEALPSRWFYDGSPVIHIKQWGELGRLLEKIEDETFLQEMHQKSVDWWDEKCSESAVGKFIASKLNP